MNYDDNIETLDKLLNAIDEAVLDNVEMGIPLTYDPYRHYIINKNGGICTDIAEIVYTLDEKLEELESERSEKLQ